MKRKTLKLPDDFFGTVQAFLQVKPKARKKPTKTGRKKMGARKDLKTENHGLTV